MGRKTTIFLVLAIFITTSVFAAVLSGSNCHAKAKVIIKNGKDFIKVVDSQECKNLKDEEMYEVEYMFTHTAIEKNIILGVEHGSTKSLEGSIDWIQWTLPNGSLLTNTSSKPWMF